MTYIVFFTTFNPPPRWLLQKLADWRQAVCLHHKPNTILTIRLSKIGAFFVVQLPDYKYNITIIFCRIDDYLIFVRMDGQKYELDCPEMFFKKQIRKQPPLFQILYSCLKKLATKKTIVNLNQLTRIYMQQWH